MKRNMETGRVRLLDFHHKFSGVLEKIERLETGSNEILILKNYVMELGKTGLIEPDEVLADLMLKGHRPNDLISKYSEMIANHKSLEEGAESPSKTATGRTRAPFSRKPSGKIREAVITHAHNITALLNEVNKDDEK